MFLHQRFVPGLAIASYLIGDEQTKELAVIDPTRDVEDFVRIATEQGMQISHILETHVHADFVSGSRELKHRLEGKPTIHCSGMGGPDWTPVYADQVVRDGDEIRLGKLRLRAVHTPGHTPEHVSWALFDDARSADTPWVLFSGDFVFVGDVGRPDLLGDVARQRLAHQLYDSVFKTIAPLPDFTEVFPGHGAGSLCGKAIGSRRSSTLGFERRFNVSMKPMSEPAWTESLLKGMPKAPPYFARMKKINRDGPPILGQELPGRRALTPREIVERLPPSPCTQGEGGGEGTSEIRNGSSKPSTLSPTLSLSTGQGRQSAIILDTRAPEDFAPGHVPGSINIPLAEQFASWAGWVLPADRPIVLVISKPEQLREIQVQLTRIGFDDIQGYLDGGVSAWQSAGYEIARLTTITADTLRARLKSDAPPLVLDVRTPSEWESGHVESAMHIPFGEVESRASELPRDREIAVMCGAGNRSSIAASILKRTGFRSVSSLTGGMSAWNQLGATAFVKE